MKSSKVITFEESIKNIKVIELPTHDMRLLGEIFIPPSDEAADIVDNTNVLNNIKYHIFEIFSLTWVKYL